jgi:hypothetical protein
MSLKSWFESLRALVVDSPRRHSARLRPGSQLRRSRLALEALEDRQLPALTLPVGMLPASVGDPPPARAVSSAPSTFASAPSVSPVSQGQSSISVAPQDDTSELFSDSLVQAILTRKHQTN